MAISLDQANCVIHTLGSLKYEQNSNKKLCYSDTEICLDWSSGTVRAVSSALTKASSYLPEWALPKGWSRDLESLNPLIEKVASCMLKTIKAPTEIVVTIGKIEDAQAGLRTLSLNEYSTQPDKMALVQRAIGKLGETVFFMKGKLKAADVSALENATLVSQNATQGRRIKELEARVLELDATQGSRVKELEARILELEPAAQQADQLYREHELLICKHVFQGRRLQQVEAILQEIEPSEIEAVKGRVQVRAGKLTEVLQSFVPRVDALKIAPLDLPAVGPDEVLAGLKSARQHLDDLDADIAKISSKTPPQEEVVVE
jgi:hypothetical protein